MNNLVKKLSGYVLATFFAFCFALQPIALQAAASSSTIEDALSAATAEGRDAPGNLQAMMYVLENIAAADTVDIDGLIEGINLPEEQVAKIAGMLTLVSKLSDLGELVTVKIAELAEDCAALGANIQTFASDFATMTPEQREESCRNILGNMHRISGKIAAIMIPLAAIPALAPVVLPLLKIVAITFVLTHPAVITATVKAVNKVSNALMKAWTRFTGLFRVLEDGEDGSLTEEERNAITENEEAITAGVIVLSESNEEERARRERVRTERLRKEKERRNKEKRQRNRRQKN